MIKRHLAFIGNFLQDRYIGAITPTTSFCVKRLCKKIDFTKDNIIVEYGAGDGVFTRHILSSMTAGSRLIAIETNDRFVEELKKLDDKRLTIVKDSAEKIKSILPENKKADYVISGIPFSMFDRRLKLSIIRNTFNSLKPGGQFLIYQYSFHVKKYLRRYFKTIRSDFEILNLPPYFIMQAIK